jgi:autotransporter-associated beta strand protein
MALAPLIGALTGSAQANSEYDVVNGSLDLTAQASYTQNANENGTGVGSAAATNPPGSNNDIAFDSGVVYTSPTLFTIGMNTSFGSLNDLSATAITISNTGGTAPANLILGGGSSTGDGVSGAFSSDLFYVKSGSNLTITGGTGNAALGLVLGESGNFDVAGTSAISSIISGGFGITKIGTGTLTLSAANTYSGTTSVNGGTLAVSGSLASTTLAVGGGIFSKTGTTAINFTTGGTSVNAGFSQINNTNATGALTLGTFTRATAGLVQFSTTTGNINTSSSNDASGIIGPWATIGSGTNANYAISNGTGVAISALTGQTALPTITGSATTNYSLTTSPTLTGAVTSNTIQATGSTALTLANGGFNLTTNGILNDISNALTISGTGKLLAGANQELDLITNSKQIAISSIIADSTAGASAVVLGGTAAGTGSGDNATIYDSLTGANTFTGGLYINSGVASPGAATSFGSTSSITANELGNVYLGAAGSDQYAGIRASLTLANPITVNPGGARFISPANGNAGIFSGAITLNGGATLSIATGGGNVSLTGGITGTGNIALTDDASRTASETISGGAVNNVGTITNTAPGSEPILISSNIGADVTALTQNASSSVLSLSGTNTFFGDTTVTKGTLNIRSSLALQNSVLITNSTAGTETFGTSTTVAINAVSLGGLAGTANINLNNTLTTPTAVALTIGNSNLTNNSSANPNTLNPIYSGVLSNTNGAASVTKVGTNTQTFSGLNTYTGFTNISGGTLTAGIAGTATSGPFGANTPVYLANTANTNLNLQTYSNQIASLSGGGSTGGNVQVGSGATLTIGGASITKSFGGSISGLGGLTLNATGISTQTLTGANTYSGPTTVTAGTLALAGQLLGDTAITVAGGASLIAQPGTGNLIIGASNASLNLNAGSRFSMQDGSIGTVTLNGAASTNVLTLGGTSGSPTNLTFEVSSTGTADELVIPNGLISFAGTVNDISLVKVGTGAPSMLTNIPLIYAPNSSNGIALADFNLSTAALSLNGTSYTTSLSTENGANGDYLYLNLTAAAGASSYFTGAGSNGSWATAGNFATDHTGNSPQTAIPTAANVVLTADSANNFTSETLDGSYTVNSLTFTGGNTSASGNPISLSAGSGGTLVLNAGAAFNVTSGSSSPVTTSYAAGVGIEVQPGSASNTISAPIMLAASQTWEIDSASGILTVNGGIGDGGLNFSLTKTGVGTLILGGTNSYSGGTIVTAGTLQLAGGDASALPLNGTLTVNGGTFDLNGNSESLPALSDGGVSTGTITSTSGAATLTFSGANPVSFSGAITGPISLTSSGGATITLSGSNSYTGPTTVSSGTIVAASNSALGSSSASTAGLVLSGTAAADFTSASPAIASLTGVTANSVVLGNSATSSPTQLIVGGNGLTTTFAGVISDLHATNSAAMGSLNVAGGTLVLTGTNTYTGTTSIAMGATLQLGNNGSTGALAGAGGPITDNGTLTFSRNANFSQGTDFSASPLGGTGIVVINEYQNSAQYQVTFNQPNTYSGGTYINGGNLSLNGNSSSPTLYATAAGTGPIYLGANGSNTAASIASGGISAMIFVNYANPIVVEPGGNRYTYTANAPGVTYSGLFTLVGGATLGFGVNGPSPYMDMTGGVVGTGNLEIGCPLSARTTTFNISGGAINMVGTVSDYITYGSQLGSGSTVNISANIGANVTGLLQDATNVTMTLTGSNTYTGGTSVTSGKLVLGSATAFPNNTALAVSSGATVQIANNGTGTPSVPVLSSLSNSGNIDIANNAMVIHNGSIGTINAEVASAYNNGAWNGTNTGIGIITSSTAAANTTHLTAVGVATNLSTFEGASVSPTDVLVKYTYYGDALLTGSVTSADYAQIDNGFLSQGSADPLTGWQNGDFNYDNVINGSDYTLIDNAFNMQGAQIATQFASPTGQVAGSGVSSAVPEPTTLGLLGMAAIGLLGRRANRKRR